MRYAVGITTCERPGASYLDASLSSIAAAGFSPPRVFEDVPPLKGPCAAFRHALSELVRDEEATHCLLFQDDVQVAKGLCGWLVENMPDGGLVSLYCPSALHSETPGWRCIQNVNKRNAPGPLGMVMPRDWVLEYLEFEEPSGLKRPATHSIGDACERMGTPVFVHSPSFIRHIGERSAVGMRQNMPPLITQARQCKVFVEDATHLAQGSENGVR